MMNKIEEAILFATILHQGKVRKLGNTPFILHPLEVAQILSTMTDDQDVITAGILHDVVEDTFSGRAPSTRRRPGTGSTGRSPWRAASASGAGPRGTCTATTTSW